MRTRRGARALLVVGLMALMLIGLTPVASAHPLGNFTSNTFLRLAVQPEALKVDYVVDLAEIPALQVAQRIDADRNGDIGPQEGRTYAERRCAELAQGLQLAVDATGVALVVQQSQVSFPPGQAGLDTLRLECDLSTAALQLEPGAQLTVRDTNLADRVGWREIVAVADGRQIQSSDAPSTSVSDELRAYPEAQLSSPLDRTEASVVVGDIGDTAAQAATPAARGPVAWIERVTTSFTEAVASRDLTVAFALTAALIAIGLGAVHALAPGHGKTVMAAYLVGREGTGREAIMLGATVAVTHTTGVLLLGIVVSASQTLAPERLYPALGAASGLLFAVVGVTLLRQALANRGSDHQHDHAHGHDHPHHGDHVHPRPARRGVGWRALIVPGLAGGLVPTPSALVVLLGGIAIGRAWFGVALVLAYGVGMAATLVAAGYLLLRARTRLQRRSADRAGRLAALTAAMPVVTAVVITFGGVVIAARSIIAA